MKALLLFLFICSAAFAGDYSYKVMEFIRVKNTDTGLIESATMTVQALKDGVSVDERDGLSVDEIKEYEKDSSYEKIIAERIAASAKISLDRKIKETTKIVVERHDKSKLDAIVIDAAKVK